MPQARASDRSHVEFQVDDESVVVLGAALLEVLADTHGAHDAVPALRTLAGGDADERPR